MSYDIYLTDPVTHRVIEIDEPHFMRGGTYKYGGDTELHLNITYNYARWYYRKEAFGDGGIRSIYGLSGLESIPVFTKVIYELERLDEDMNEEEIERAKEKGVDGYWLPTKENAIKPLFQLIAMAKMRPDGIWEGD